MNSITSSQKPIARIGLIAKGIVYVLLGLLAFMAAFHLGGQSTRETSKEDVISTIKDQTGGQIMLVVIAVGLLCYSVWRGMQSFADTTHKGSDAKGLAVRARYFYSGLIYGALSLYSFKRLFTDSSGNRSRQNMIQQLLSYSYGQWVLGIIAAIIFCTGLYQCYYGLSEKYRKHVSETGNRTNNKLLLAAGKLGYMARGIVWLIIGWMFAKAALHSNSSEAGDTSRAFSFLASGSYGSYLLAITGFGLICYGLFNFIRARYERF